MKKAILAIITLLLAKRAFCAELLVPAQHPTIQAAIDAAGEGDVIVVQPGIYHENIQWNVNNLTITSINPEDPCVVAATIIDGDGGNTIVCVVSGGLLRGFTVTGGQTGIFGGSADITNCIIRENQDGIAYFYGTISNCLICLNSSYGMNNVDVVINCTIADNRIGVRSVEIIANSIVWGNSSEQIDRDWIYDPIFINNSCVQGWSTGLGNIGEDPLFVDAAGGDYRLQEGPPCIDAGKNRWPEAMPKTDLGGNFRQIDGDEDGIAVVDMGAYEYGTAAGPIVSAQPEQIVYLNSEGVSSGQMQHIYISNVGPGVLNWVITEDCPWLGVTPLSGTSSGEISEVTLTADTAGLGLGRHTCCLTVNDSAGSSRAIVQVDCVIVDESCLIVPDEFPTIQSAVDAAANDDTVIVAPGTYTGEGNQRISISGKAITVRSIDPNDPCVVDNTIIRGKVSLCSDAGTMTIFEGFTITNEYGGGISVCDSSPLIRNCVITNNASGYGGGIYCLSGCTVIGCRISNNYASEGGGVYCWNNMTIINCVISNNRAGSKGGGIMAYRGIIVVDNCKIVNNQASKGGGIYAEVYASVNNCEIMNNQAGEGGGIYTTGPVQVKKSVITGNTAVNNGGGAYAYPANLDISDSIISANLSQKNGGGLYGRVLAQGCTIAGNTAIGEGGGIYNYLSLINNILWGNSDAGGTGLAAQISPVPLSLSSWRFNCVQDANLSDTDTIKYGNISDDPLFVREPNDGGDGWGVGDNDDYGDLHLLPDSPCIDAGNPLFGARPNTMDIDGRPRIIGFARDMGAYEYGKLIDVTKPRGSEVWAAHSRHKIEWYSYGVESVDILLSRDGGENWETIAESITNADCYLWELPGRVDSNQCIISVVPSDGDIDVICYESGLFTIKPYPYRPPVPFGWPRRCILPAPDLSDNKGPVFGCVKWVFETTGAVFSRVALTRPDFRGGYRVYIGCEDGKLYALNEAGQRLWSYNTDTPIVGSPAVGYYGMVYVAGQNGRLYAIDYNGELRWTHDTKGPVCSTPVVGYDGKIYVGSEDGMLYALAADGSELWTFATKGPANLKGAILATPSMGKCGFYRHHREGEIYVAGLYDPNLYALDSNDGSVQWVCNFEWAVEPNNGPQAGQPVAACALGRDGTIYQTLAHDTNLYAIDADNGTIIRRTNLADTGSGLYGDDYAQRFWYAAGWCEPVIGPDGTIYVSLDDPYLRAIRPDGTIKWVTRLGMVGGFTLSVGRYGLIYAASDDGTVCVVSPAGSEISRFEGSAWVSYPVIAEDGALIVSDSNNRVWAIGSKRCWGKTPVLHTLEDIWPSRTVDFMDLALLAEGWLECTDPYNYPLCGSGIKKYDAYPPGDINRDQYVDFMDFVALAEQWLTETPANPWGWQRWRWGAMGP